MQAAQSLSAPVICRQLTIAIVVLAMLISVVEAQSPFDTLPPPPSAGTLPPPAQRGTAPGVAPQMVAPGIPIEEVAPPPNPENVVAEVRIEGNESVPISRIRPHLRVRAGREFNNEQVIQDKRALISTRMFVDVRPAIEKTAQGIVVTYRVVERPVLQEVRYEGNYWVRLSALKKATGLKPGESHDPIAVAEARRKIADLYDRRGFNHAEVEVVEGLDPNDRRAIFRIHEGPRQKIQSINFAGNKDISSALLQTKLESSIAWGAYVNLPTQWQVIFGDYDPDKVESDVDKLQAYYHSLGYWSVRISRVVEFSESRDEVYLTFVVDEGPRFSVNQITVAGNELHGTPELMGMMKLRSGDKFLQRTLQEDVAKIKDLYGGQGYVFADVQPDIRFLEEPAKLDIVYHISEGARYRVGRIDVKVNGDYPHTRITTVLNKISLNPGDVLDIRELRNSERRLRAAGIFKVDPQRGVAPKITFSAPGMPSGGSVRGQSPDQFVPNGPLPDSDLLQVTIWEPGTEPLDGTQHVPVEEQPAEVPVRLISPPLPVSPEDRLWAPHQPFEQAPSTPTAPDMPLGMDWEPQGHWQSNTNIAMVNIVDEVRQGFDRHEAWLHEQQRRQQIAWAGPPYAPPHQVHRQAPQGPIVRGQDGGYGVQGRQPGFATEQAQYQPPPQGFNQGPQFNPAPAPQPFVQNGAAVPPPQPGVPGEPPILGQPPFMDPFGGDPALDLEAVVEETETGRFMIGAGFNSEAGLVGNIVLEEQNFDITRFPRSFQDFVDGTAFRGNGERFRLEASPGTEVSRYLFSWRNPNIFDSPNSLGVSGSYYQRIFRDWDEERLSARFSLGRQITPDLSATLSTRVEDIQISDPRVNPPPQELAEVLGSNSLLGLSFNLTHDTRDSPFLPTEGTYVSFEAEQVLGSFTYPRGTIEARRYYWLFSRPDGSGRHVLSFSGQVSITGSDTPIYDNFFAGGFSTIRGFAFRGASPRKNDVIVGGEFMTVGSVEYSFPLRADDIIRGAVFVDAGVVEESLDFDSDNLRVAPGFGLRIAVPALGPAPIALDFAFPVQKNDYDDTRIFQFYISAVR